MAARVRGGIGRRGVGARRERVAGAGTRWRAAQERRGAGGGEAQGSGVGGGARREVGAQERAPESSAELEGAEAWGQGAAERRAGWLGKKAQVGGLGFWGLGRELERREGTQARA